jgi:CheY-like chemotaxis protein
MQTIYLLCVDDEADVLDAVVRELAPLEDVFPVEAAASAAEARQRLDAIAKKGDAVGVLFCDHIMPGQSGVDLLVDLQKDPRWQDTRKVLLTGQAGLDATVKAVNQADLAHYIAKPWDRDELLKVARKELGEFLIVRDINPMPYLSHLDAAQLGPLLRRHLDGDR